MGEALRKACPAIDLKQQVGNLDTRQRVIGCIPEGLCPWWGRKSRSLAFHLHGARFGEGDLCVMIKRLPATAAVPRPGRRSWRLEPDRGH